MLPNLLLNFVIGTYVCMGKMQCIYAFVYIYNCVYVYIYICMYICIKLFCLQFQASPEGLETPPVDNRGLLDRRKTVVWKKNP